MNCFVLWGLLDIYHEQINNRTLFLRDIWMLQKETYNQWQHRLHVPCGDIIGKWESLFSFLGDILQFTNVKFVALVILEIVISVNLVHGKVINSEWIDETKQNNKTLKDKMKTLTNSSNLRRIIYCNKWNSRQTNKIFCDDHSYWGCGLQPFCKEVGYFPFHQ